ncbi:MAG: carbohydrate-binding family 6 protein [Saprospiraceae bacterium]|nr:carbohydrate-binding family 6 protein [Saprospiraceae bacterium]
MKSKYFELPAVILMVICLWSSMGCDNENTVRLFAERDHPQIQFAVDEIRAKLQAKGLKVLTAGEEGADIVLSLTENASIGTEGFQLSNNQGKIQVSGQDAAGVMYGGLELAEQISISGLEGVQSAVNNPYMQMRGTKFNIPLDVRTPSYTDVSDVAQKNIPEMWNFDFWKEYIDNLALHRYNYISLWNLHPFPSLVKVPGYEDVALDDVQRSTHQFDEHYNTNGWGFCSPEILANPEIIKNITIEEKIEFWRKVMAYGKSRNVDFYVITWNIFVHGAKDKYGITDQIDNAVTRDYFRKSVKQMFVTYPDLAGIGLTTGENMYGNTFQEKEDWAFETYGQGVLDAAAEMPDRKIRFIHRQHMAAAKDISERFKPLIDNENIDFIFSFKYAKAHVMSAVDQPYHYEFVEDIKANDIKTIWTLRNDDAFYFRWGAPDFVRQFVKNIPHEVSQGYYYGSDQWVWGREFTTKNPDGPREIELTKHWYHWMLWGRFAYDPDVPNERIIGILQARFPETDAQKLFTAWQDASMVYPTTTGFHWGWLDFMWYIEGCKGRERFTKTETDFHDVNSFINVKPHKNSGFQSIPDYVQMVLADSNTELKTPLEVSQMLHAYADNALKLAGGLSISAEGIELKATLHDIKTIAYLGKYYANKIDGATQLALYRATDEGYYQEKAVAHLRTAKEYWIDYAETANAQNVNPIWTNRVGHVDWMKAIDFTTMDVEIAREK